MSEKEIPEDARQPGNKEYMQLNIGCIDNKPFPAKCDFCHKREATKRLPHICDFNIYHSINRLGLIEKKGDFGYYLFEDKAEEIAWHQKNRFWYVTSWHNVCSRCYPRLRESPESLERMFRYVGRGE